MEGFTVKRFNRVINNNDFTRIIQQGTSTKTNALVLYYTCNSDHLTVGFAVSKKVGNAVTRNKIKRQLRAIFQNYVDKYPHFEIIVVVRKNYLDYSFQQIDAMVEKMLDKMEIKLNEQEK